MGGSKPGVKDSTIRLAPIEGRRLSSRPIGTAGDDMAVIHDTDKSQLIEGDSPSSAGYVFGFLLPIAGTLLAVLSEGVWSNWLAKAGAPWNAESCRWILSGILIVVAVSFLRSKPVNVLFVGALVLLTGYTTDALLQSEPSAVLNDWFGSDIAGRVLVLFSVAVAYLLHLGRDVRQPIARGVFSLGLIALASHALIAGWFDAGLGWAAPQFGPNGQSVFEQWGQEVAWGCAIVLTAIGVASSRTRTIHFMNAVLLFCLAIYCIRSGMSREVMFPTLNASLTEVSIKNVMLWRWVAAGELILLSIVLLHQALGIGGLCMVWAVTWMIGGVSIYREFGSLEFSRVAGKGIASMLGQSAAAPTQTENPFSNMGLPVAEQAEQQERPESEHRHQGAILRKNATPRVGANPRVASPNAVAAGVVDQKMIVREATRQVWLLFTSILAGIIGITGVRTMFSSFKLRMFMFLLLWIATALGVVFMYAQVKSIYDTRQTVWIVEWTQSGLHLQACWVAFALTMSIAGCWALLDEKRKDTWLHVTVYATFIGTILSLVGVSLLIGFGGFSGLPVWTYIVIAAGQSSLAWIILMHMSMHAREAGHATSLL